MIKQKNATLFPIAAFVLIILFSCSLDITLKDRNNPYDNSGDNYGGQPPNISIISPTNGQIIAPSFTLNGSASDDIGLTYVYVNINNGDFIAIPLKGTNTNWSYSFVAIPFGNTVIKAFSKDIGSKTSTTVNINVVVDASLPGIGINSPASGVLTNINTVTLSGPASVSSIYSINKIAVENSGGIWNTAAFSGSGGNYSWTYSVALSEGTNTFMAMAVTSASKTNYSAYTVIILDTTAPMISLTNLTNYQIFGDGFQFSGTVYDQYAGGSRVFIKLDNSMFSEVSVSSNTFNTNISLIAWEGLHTNYYYTMDALGNTSATNSLIVVFSSRMPMIYITSPANYYITNSLTMPVSGSNTIGVFYTITNLQARANGGA